MQLTEQTTVVSPYIVSYRGLHRLDISPFFTDHFSEFHPSKQARGDLLPLSTPRLTTGQTKRSDFFTYSVLVAPSSTCDWLPSEMSKDIEIITLGTIIFIIVIIVFVAFYIYFTHYKQPKCCGDRNVKIVLEHHYEEVNEQRNIPFNNTSQHIVSNNRYSIRSYEDTGYLKPIRIPKNSTRSSHCKDSTISSSISTTPLLNSPSVSTLGSQSLTYPGRPVSPPYIEPISPVHTRVNT